jgi:predicted nucleic acid-binding Zn ribbon protein
MRPACSGLFRRRINTSGRSQPKWNEGLWMPLTRSQRNAAMQRAKHPPIRNKINLADPAHVRAWTRRLRISADALKAVVGKVGNSVAAVTKEIELQRASRQPSPVPIPNSAPREPAESELPAPV